LKLARLLLIVALVGISCSVARAQDDPDDPKPFTQGCGGAQQPACDPNYITNPNQPLILNNPPLTFEQVKNNPNEFLAETEIINESGQTITNFTVSFAVNAGLVFDGLGTSNPCTTPPGGVSLFTCTPDFQGAITSGYATYTFSGFSLCSTDPSDWVTDGYNDGGWFLGPNFECNQQPTCQAGFILGLIGTTNTPGGDSHIHNGETVASTLYVPEPSSILLLLVGFASAFGLFVFRRVGVNLA
jgi:hypothetical protein